MESLSTTANEAEVQSIEYAGFWRRLLAFIVDVVIVGVAVYLGVMIESGVWRG